MLTIKTISTFVTCFVTKRIVIDRINRDFTKNNIYVSPQCPSAGFEKKNVSKVCRIFLESILYDNSKMVCLKILALGISELTLPNDPKKL